MYYILCEKNGGGWMKNNREIVSFLKQKDYIMINNDLGGGSLGKNSFITRSFY